MSPPLYIDRPFESTRALCDELGRLYWHRGPVVFRNHGLGELLGGADDVLRGLRNLRRLASPPRLYVDGDRALATERHWCTDGDATIAEYVARLIREHGARELLVLTDEFERSDEELWLASARFLGELYGAIGLPAGPAQINLFAGVYQRTPFKFHKDIGDSITYALAGHKRYLIWDYDEVARHLRLPAGSRHENMLYEHYDYERLRAYATVLDTQPGDLYYWPWDCFHLAEPTDGELSISISFGIVPFAAPLAGLESMIARTRHAARCEPFRLGGQADPAAAALAAMGELLADAELHSELAAEQLCRRTRFGFKRPLPLAEVADEDLSDDAELVSPAAGVLAWTQQGATMLVAANGHGFTVDHDPTLVALLTELGQGRTMRVGELRGRWCTEEGFDPNDFEQLLACLLRFRALVRVAARPRVATGPRLPADLFQRSGLFPLAMADGGRTVLLGKISDDDHRRVDGFRVEAVRVGLADLVERYEHASPMPTRQRWIFTAGYCGSTLVCKCIDEMPGCFAIHEPRILGEWSLHYGRLADPDERRAWLRTLAPITALLFRTSRPDDCAVVKVGTHVQELMAELLQLDAQARGVHLFASLPRFLAAIAKSVNRRIDLRANASAPQRRRMVARIGGLVLDPDAMTDLQAAAYVWVTDLQLRRSIAASPGGPRLRGLDFDHFLEHPEVELRDLADHLELALAPAHELAIAGGEVLHRHAKAAEGRYYDARTRDAILAASLDEHRCEIQATLRWVDDRWGESAMEPTATAGLETASRIPAQEGALRC